MDSHDWDERYRASELVWSAEPNQWVRQHTDPLSPGAALDLACGEGRNAIWLARRGWRVTAVDFSAVAVAKATRLASQYGADVAARIHWVVGDVVSYEPLDQYDLALVVYLHLPAAERATVLRRAGAAVAVGGTLLVVGHHLDNLAHGVGGPPDPQVLYTEDDISADLAVVPDLRIHTAQCRQRWISDKPRPALDVVVEARRRATAATT